jgi:GTP-binding protein HflX
MRETQIVEVNRVLKEINADHIPQIVVWNKIDAQYALPSVKLDEAGIERDAQGHIVSVRVSGLTGTGLDLLRAAIIEKIEAVPPLPVARLQAWHPLD